MMQEKISAMLDGEWDDQELAQLMASIEDEETESSSCWQTYHLIGDAMNQRCGLSGQFMANFSARLESEPVILAPNALRRRRLPVPARRWVAFSVAASVALVSATAWYAGGNQIMNQPAGGVAQVVVAANQPSQTAEQNPYLLAHQAMVGNPGFSHRPVILTGAEAERITARH